MKRIMIVDDDRDIVQLMQEALEVQGYEVATAYDGFECLEKVDHFKPDMILLDIMMPKMSGWEVLQRLDREFLPENDTKVVMLTAKELCASDTQREVFPDLVHYIRKPVTLPKLFSQIEEIFTEEQRLVQEAEQVSRTLGQEFGGGYQDIITTLSRKRRIFSTVLERKESLEIVTSPKEIKGLLQTVENVEKELKKLKVLFNPMVYFFSFGIEKELRRIKTYLSTQLEKDEESGDHTEKQEN